MMKRLICLLIAFMLPCVATAAIIDSDNFDSDADWTVTQPTGADQRCYSSCGMPGGWTGYTNGMSYCTTTSDKPGNNNLYIHQYAGYPLETNVCRGGSGKCVTQWSESCTNLFENSDGMLGRTLTNAPDLGYEEIYVRFYIRFKANFEMRALSGEDGGSFKLWHIQHQKPGHDPFIYLGTSGYENNVPLSSGGINQWSNYIQLYAENRCQTTYYCRDAVVWPISTVTAAYQSGGIFDGNWHRIILRQKRNSAINTADGIIEFWLDSNKITPWAGPGNTNINYNDSGSSELRGWRYLGLGGNNNNQFDTSCSTTADCEQWYSIDDVVVATTYQEAVDGSGSDTTAPTVSITTSSPQTIATDSLTVTGTASDAVGVTSCKYRIGAEPGASAGTACTGTTSWSGTVSGFSQGANTLYVGCGDAAGNWTSPAASITVNYTPLAANILKGGRIGYVAP